MTMDCRSICALEVEGEDAAIAAIYSAHDLAIAVGKSPIEAIEWLRTGIDVIERGLMKRG